MISSTRTLILMQKIQFIFVFYLKQEGEVQLKTSVAHSNFLQHFSLNKLWILFYNIEIENNLKFTYLSLQQIFKFVQDYLLLIFMLVLSGFVLKIIIT